MSILIANDGSRVVDTIASRDAIPKRFSGMEVTVRDATADPEFGGGTVTYRWDSQGSRWLPVWSELRPDLSFTTEEKPIVDGQVVADHPPKDQKVWSAFVIHAETGEVLADAVPTVSSQTLQLGGSQFDGHRLRFTYAYGSMSTQLAQIWSQKADIHYVDQKIAELEIPEVGGEGTVTSVNGVVPDESGNVTLTAEHLNLTKESLGLDQVANLPVADDAVAVAMASTEYYLVPSNLAAVFSDMGITRDPETQEWLIPGGDVEEAPSELPNTRYVRTSEGTWQQLLVADVEEDMAPGTQENEKVLTPKVLEQYLAERLGIVWNAEVGDFVMDEGTISELE